MDKNLMILMKSKKTIFTTDDLALLWNTENAEYIRKKMYRYVKSEDFYSPRKGFYTKDSDYDRKELSNRIFTPSYISFETVLVEAGVIFQYYSQIFVASYLSREIAVDNQIYVYRKIKDSILTNDLGIETRNNYFIASPERAFLDMLYLNTDYYFDNPGNLDWDKVEKILPIFGGNKRMKLKVKKIRNV